MHILAHVHAYPPKHNAGAEWMLHAMLAEMVRRGHRATVLIPDVTLTEPYHFDGVEVMRFGGNAERVYPTCDVVITHLETGGYAPNAAPQYCKRFKKPLARLVHNERELFSWKATGKNTQLAIFNSNWIANTYNALLTEGWNQMVIYPPVDADHYKTPRDKADAITLINLCDNKGAPLFYELAEAMPDRHFIGVKGGYAMQMIQHLPNVTIISNTPDIKSVYARTRILLTPSLIETWGRVAIEAMSSGIPVIAHPTAGLKEACSDAGIFVDRQNVQGYIDAIKALDDPKLYKTASDRALKRAQTIPYDFDTLESKLQELSDMVTFKHTSEPKKIVETISAIVVRNFTDNGAVYAIGKADIPVERVAFLASRGLIVVPKSKPDPDAPTRDDKSDPSAPKRKTKAA
jgi:glycosyltransferase involved in cell wall biosynthesis